MKLYVGNLPWATQESDLSALFERYKITGYVRILKDQETGRSKGFGFVEVQEGDEAIADLDGQPYEGRILKVSHAIRKQPQPR